VLYSVAIKYSKGDMSDSSDKSKCFLKCFAFRLGLFNETTGSPQKDALLDYVTFLPSGQLPVSDNHWITIPPIDFNPFAVR
jgi:hypothetical protein